MKTPLKQLRRLYAWFLWGFMDHHREARNWLLFVLKKRYPIFLDYPVNLEPRYGYGKPPHRKLYEIINRERIGYGEYVRQIASFKEELAGIAVRGESETMEPTWENSMLPGLDGMSIFSMIAIHRPKRYFEVGSGNSTKFARFAIRMRSLNTTITSIDPVPRVGIDEICDRIIRAPVEEVPLSEFDVLDAGDVLFIDNSHRAFMNSDVTVTFLDILPRLKPGVLVGFHDINLPYDYGPNESDRYYSEQYLLATHLLAEGLRSRILLAVYFVTMDDELRALLDLIWTDSRFAAVQRAGTSFWIEMR
jgi:Methyltransferase domain